MCRRHRACDKICVFAVVAPGGWPTTGAVEDEEFLACMCSNAEKALLDRSRFWRTFNDFRVFTRTCGVLG